MFAGEVILGTVILLFARRIADAPVGVRPHLDLLGSLLSASGMGLAVIGVLRSSEWGWLLPATGAPSLLGMSPVFWLILGGLVVALAVHAAHPASRGGRGRAARQSVAVRQPPDDRRARHVLLPVHGDDGDLLRDPAVPVGRARALGDRDRHQDHAAVDHDAARARRASRGSSRQPRRGGSSRSGSWR